jgi:hypothetical protein
MQAICAHTLLTGFEVNPWVETVCKLTVCRLLKKHVHFIASPSGLSPVGEAETGSGGDQPVKE